MLVGGITWVQLSYGIHQKNLSIPLPIWSLLSDSDALIGLEITYLDHYH
jgi:hypothetical protein